MLDILLSIFIVVLSIVIAIYGTILVRKKYGHEHLSKHNDVAGFIYAVIGVIYAVLIAFVVIVVWENHQEAHQIVENEAISIAAIQSLSSGFEKDFATKVENNVQSYLKVAITDDWELMKSEKKFSQLKIKPSDKYFDDLRTLILNHTPANAKEDILLDKMIDKLEDTAQNRKLRFFTVKLNVPSFMWFIIIVGGILVILFGMLFSSANLWAQLVMISILSSTICLVLLLIFAMNHPYSGLILVDADSFINLLNN